MRQVKLTRRPPMALWSLVGYVASGELSHNEGWLMLVIGYIKEHSNLQNPSNEHLSDMTGLSVQEVARTLKSLSMKEIVKRQKNGTLVIDDHYSWVFSWKIKQGIK